MNKKGFAISGIIYSILILFLLLIFAILSVLGGRKLILDKLKNTVISDLNSSFEVNKDTSGANPPELLDNMVPIYYNGFNWIYADITKPWYNYDEHKWANAVVLNKEKQVGDIIKEEDIDLWYVWIPRYKYQIFDVTPINQEIKIEFETGTNSTGTFRCEDLPINSLNQTPGISERCYKLNNGILDKSKEYKPNTNDLYTHPAFTFGEKDLMGFWVGKFEISGSLDKILIKPNQKILLNQSLPDLFNSISKISNKLTVYDNHIIKNMEWGAIAYLTHSKYGIGKNEVWPNQNSEYITGGDNYLNNYKQSTTHNHFGVYDMSGGGEEYVFANTVKNDSNFNRGYSSFANDFLTVEGGKNKKYIDIYNYNEVDAKCDANNNCNFGKYGDATKETINWYKDWQKFPVPSYPWFIRGGKFDSGFFSGLYSFSFQGGQAFNQGSTRAVLVSNK